MSGGGRAAGRLQPYAADALRLAAVVVAYYVAAKIGLQQQLVRGQVTPFWPPTGIALVALMVWGPRMWPGIALGAFIVNVSLGPGIGPVFAITAGNTLAPVCAYLLLRRAGFRLALDRLQDALALVFLGALGGMLISATIGTGALLASGAVSAHDFWPAWSVWWTGDAMGVLIIAPFLLTARTARWPRGVSVLRWAEAVALLGGTAVATAVATDTSFQLLFLVVPFLIWAAFRFQLVGAAPCALIASVIAIYAVTVGSGPFSGRDLLAMMITLQAFNGTVALTSLLLSAAVTERNHTLEEIEKVCDHLKEALSRLTPEERPDEAFGAWPPARPKEHDQRGQRSP
ncbi:MASE1 domain-containing protein [Actinomadura sp. B10D3]|uniref:MASE1 domain-containing protein n=1 Tax=Actinomadura sp. B10D3 TaxID=3153557 RepID=UPI00325D0D5E